MANNSGYDGMSVGDSRRRYSMGPGRSRYDGPFSSMYNQILAEIAQQQAIDRQQQIIADASTGGARFRAAAKRRAAIEAASRGGRASTMLTPGSSLLLFTGLGAPQNTTLGG